MATSSGDKRWQQAAAISAKCLDECHKRTYGPKRDREECFNSHEQCTYTVKNTSDVTYSIVCNRWQQTVATSGGDKRWRQVVAIIGGDKRLPSTTKRDGGKQGASEMKAWWCSGASGRKIRKKENQAAGVGAGAGGWGCGLFLRIAPIPGAVGSTCARYIGGVCSGSESGMGMEGGLNISHFSQYFADSV